MKRRNVPLPKSENSSDFDHYFVAWPVVFYFISFYKKVHSTYINIGIGTYMHKYIDTYINTSYMHKYVHAYIHRYNTYISIYLCTFIHPYICSPTLYIDILAYTYCTDTDTLRIPIDV